MTKGNQSALLQWFWIMCAIVLAFLMFAGCREARELKKDNKAYQRVTTDLKLAKKVNDALAVQFPCQNFITKTEYIKGDTVKVPQLVFDSARAQRYLDSMMFRWTQSGGLINRDSIDLNECNRLITEAYNTAYKSAVWECNQRKIPVRVDTVYNTEADLKRIGQLEGERDVNYGMYLQSEKQAETSAKLAKNRLYWLIGICAGIGLLLFGFIWSKFKKSPLKK